MDVFVCVTSLNRIENLQKRARRLLLYGYEYKYEQLLNKAGRGSMIINRPRTLCVEIYKTLKELNPIFMKNIFTVKETDRLVLAKVSFLLN